MKKQSTLVALSVALLLLMSIYAYAGNGNANATLQVTGVAPVIVSVVSASPVTLNAGTTKGVEILFNATSDNGASDINDSTSIVVVSKSGETSRQTTPCVVAASGTLSKLYNCTVTMMYYDGAGSWNVNASVTSNEGLTGRNDTTSLTVNSLDSIALTVATIDFGSHAANTNDNAGTTEVINNTGNQNYVTIALTGYDLASGANLIGSANFCGANASNPAMCNYLVNNSAVTIPGVTLSKGAVATSSVYHYANVPSGTAVGSYAAQSNWVYTAS